jgi:hypothetical protein
MVPGQPADALMHCFKSASQALCLNNKLGMIALCPTRVLHVLRLLLLSCCCCRPLSLYLCFEMLAAVQRLLMSTYGFKVKQMG